MSNLGRGSARAEPHIRCYVPRAIARVQYGRATEMSEEVRKPAVDYCFPCSIFITILLNNFQSFIKRSTKIVEVVKTNIHSEIPA